MNVVSLDRHFLYDIKVEHQSEKTKFELSEIQKTKTLKNPIKYQEKTTKKI